MTRRGHAHGRDRGEEPWWYIAGRMLTTLSIVGTQTALYLLRKQRLPR